MSYVLSGYKWGPSAPGTPSGQILWASDIAAELDHDTDRYDPADFDAALDAAFARWESVAAVEFEEAGAGQQADLTFDMAAYPGSVAGRALIYFTPATPLDRAVEAEIIFDSTEFWAPYGVGGTDFYAVALHEIGHVLGLEHVADADQIMNATIFADDLGDGDIAGVQLLYGTDGGDHVLDDPPPPQTVEAGDDDGGGGGAGAVGGLLGGVLALILLLMRGLFGGGGGNAGAAGSVPSEGRGDGHGHDHLGEAPLLSDLIPEIPAEEGAIHLHSHDHDHDHDGHHGHSWEGWA